MSMINWADLQIAIMNVLWRLEKATVHEVIAALPVERSPAYTTVLTVLTNLEKQGYVTHEAKPGNRTFYYCAQVSQQEMQEGLIGEMLERLFAGSPASLIGLLLQTQSFTTQELREIRLSLCDRQAGEDGTEI